MKKLLSTILLLIPIASASYYWFAIATDRYESISKIVVQNNGNSQHAPNELGALIGISGGSSNDAQVVSEYMTSRALFYKIDDYLNLRDHFSGKNIDWLSRLKHDASEEEFYEYYLDKVSVYYDESTRIIEVSIQAFDAEIAQKSSQFLIMESELFINDISRRLAESQVDFATTQLSSTKDRLRGAKHDLVKFQNENGVMSPEDQAKMIGSIISNMESELSEKRARLDTISTYLNPSSSEVQLLRTQIASLRSQIKKEKNKLIGQSSGPLNELNIEYQDLLMEIGFSEDMYSSTLAAMETARLDAAKKMKHLVVIEPPSSPDYAIYPRRTYNTATSIILILLLFWTMKLSIATVRDHRD